MLTINIDNLPYMPLNRAKMLTVSGGRPMLIKTGLCREFEKDLSSRLHSLENSELFRKFDKFEHYLDVTYNIFVPEDEYFTKEGCISNKACDTDSIKVFQDTLFKAIGIDDKYVRDLHVISRPSHDGKWNYSIEIKLKELENLYV